MLPQYINNFQNLTIKDFGKQSFFLSAFFLSTALPISIFFLLISIVIYFKVKNFIFLKDRAHQVLLFCSGLMILSSFNSTQNLKPLTMQSDLNVWVGIFNWIPLFLLFVISQFYLAEISQRRIFVKFLIAGSIPVIFSCLLQAWLNITGPFEIFNGLITWFFTTKEGIAGIFSNQNYTGVWLNVILVFLIFEIKNHEGKNISKFFLIFLLILTIYFLILTGSRNSFIGMIITILLTNNPKKLVIAIPTISTFIFLLRELSLNFFVTSKLFINNISILRTFERLSETDFTNILNSQRFEIYSQTIKLIPKNPLLGWGANTFQNIYDSNGGLFLAQHTHSMPLELAFNYGIPFTLLISGFVLQIIISSILNICTKKSFNLINTVDRYWLVAIGVMLISYLSDVTYYDGKISILTWIFLAGLKCINMDQQRLKSINKFGETKNT